VEAARGEAEVAIICETVLNYPQVSVPYNQTLAISSFNTTVEGLSKLVSSRFTLEWVGLDLTHNFAMTFVFPELCTRRAPVHILHLLGISAFSPQGREVVENFRPVLLEQKSLQCVYIRWSPVFSTELKLFVLFFVLSDFV
jgi:hypothetical protein